MRVTIVLLFNFLTLTIFSQGVPESILKTIEKNSFYSISEDANRKVIIFLHGGVKNPYFNQPADGISLDYLFEGKQSFIRQAKLNGFDLIVPITNDSLNWIDKPSQTFIELKKMIAQSTHHYEEIYMSGFSDGGTGSFKIFYQNHDFFDGLIVFNGYPQHNNFNQDIDYKTKTNKKVLLLSTYKDKVIPYEFLITEYCSQKKYNPNTYIYLSHGDHSFANYTEDDLKVVFDILTDRNQNTKTEPIHGFIRNDRLVSLYPFRRKIVRKYNFGKEVYEENIKQHKKYKE